MKKISSILQKFKEEYHIDERLKLFEAVRDWDAIVGPELAKHTAPISFQERILYIETEGSAWVQEISFRKKSIIDRVNCRLGRPLVKEIRCQSADPGGRKKA